MIRLRYDAILTAFPDLINWHQDFLYGIDYSAFHNNIGNNGLIMSPEIAQTFMNIYDHMDELYNLGVLFNDEQLVTALVITKKIPFRIIRNLNLY